LVAGEDDRVPKDGCEGTAFFGQMQEKIAEKNDWQSSTWKRKKKESLCNAKNSRTFASRCGGYVITCGGNAIRYRKIRQYNYRAYINEK